MTLKLVEVDLLQDAINSFSASNPTDAEIYIYRAVDTAKDPRIEEVVMDGEQQVILKFVNAKQAREFYFACRKHIKHEAEIPAPKVML